MSQGRCEYVSPWGRCRQKGQQATEGGKRSLRLCPFHRRWINRDDEPDTYYHRKIVEGFLEPTDTVFTCSEIRTMLAGRSRGDGRRLDSYCLEDQVDPDWLAEQGEVSEGPAAG